VQVRITQTFPNSLVGEAMRMKVPGQTKSGCCEVRRLRAAEAEVEMQIRGLMMDPVTNMPIVC
jgi:hypothetical protein